MVGLTVRGKQVIGTVAQLRSALTSLQVHGIDLQKIAVAVPEKSLSAKHHAALDRILAETPISVVFLDSLFGEATGSDMEQEAAHPKIGRVLRSYGPFKSCLDIFVSCILLIVTSPLFAAVALLTLVDLGRPICFWQKRMGRRGQSITLYKFRTMRSPLGPHGEKLIDSERTSAIGHFLRKTRLDELPQLLNIFHGDMSFVGPRPLLPIDQPAEVMERLSVKPGLTGWAQVNGGKLVTPEEKRALDLWYVGHANLWLDMKIAWMTLEMFVRGDRLNTASILAATDWLHLRDSMALLNMTDTATAGADVDADAGGPAARETPQGEMWTRTLARSWNFGSRSRCEQNATGRVRPEGATTVLAAELAPAGKHQASPFAELFSLNPPGANDGPRACAWSPILRPQWDAPPWSRRNRSSWLPF